MKQKLHSRQLPFSNKLARALWHVVWLILFRTSPRPFHVWRCFLLRMFGAKIGNYVHIYPTAKIWAPWNLEMHEGSGIGEEVDVYCVDKIVIGIDAAVSQYTFLCTATHDYNYIELPLLTAPIVLEKDSWVTADVFIGPGVTIGEGAVVLARSSVTKDVEPWTIVSGNPAKFTKYRTIERHLNDSST